MGLFSGLRDALGIGGGRNRSRSRPDFNTGGQVQRQPTAAQRPKPNPRREYNQRRGADGESNISRWEKYSKPNFSVADIDTGEAIRVAKRTPVKIPTRIQRSQMDPRGEGGEKPPQSTRSAPAEDSKAPSRMVRGVQKKRGGAALGSARFTRKGLGGINRANNRKLGGI